MTSPLGRDDIVRLLRESVDGPWTFFGDRPVVGSIGQRSFWIRKRIRYRNSFQTVLYGQLIDAGGATRIRCRAGMHGTVLAVLAVWFSGVTMAIVAITPQAIGGDGMDAVAFIPVLMLLFGVGLVWFGRRMARGELHLLVACLEDTIDARRVD